MIDIARCPSRPSFGAMPSAGGYVESTAYSLPSVRQFSTSSRSHRSTKTECASICSVEVLAAVQPLGLGAARARPSESVQSMRETRTLSR